MVTITRRSERNKRARVVSLHLCGCSLRVSVWPLCLYGEDNFENVHHRGTEIRRDTEKYDIRSSPLVYSRAIRNESAI